MIRFTDEVTPRLKRIAAANTLAALGQELHAGAKAVVEDAQFSIRDGAISGAGHVVSQPGFPPNEDSGTLAESIHTGEVIEIANQVQTSVIVDADYGAALERGTSRMVERPFLGPAALRQRLHIFEALVARWRQIVRGGA